MTHPNLCAKCGRELPQDAPAGVCPRCLLRAGVDHSSCEPEATQSFCEAVASPSSDAKNSGAGLDIGTRVGYFGDYELLQEIARGGMGVVYRARQTRLNRGVALKMILAGQLASDADVARFQAEAEAAAKLDHPGIVPIFEVGEHAGHHFFSMALVEGESLAQRLVKGPLAPKDSAELLHAVALSIQYAHEKGVIHRDLKPANILIDADGQPRVTDFGLAKHATSLESRTRTGQILGTPSYMSPEQAGGKTVPVTPSSDVYALGAVLYAALCGRPPHQADNPLDTLKLVVEAEPVSPRQLNSTVPHDLETICLKCLRKDPTQRYATAFELAKDLNRYLHGKSIVARPAGRLETMRRWCRRNPKVSLLSATSALLLIAGATIASYLAVVANGQRARAEDELYRNRIMLAERELESGNAYSAQQILAQCPTNRRGWEWDYILRLSLTSPSQKLLADSKPIVGVRFSHSGDRLVSITQDGNLEVVDGRTLQPLHDIVVTDEEVVGLDLNADGAKALVGTKTQQMYVNVDDGSVIWKRASHGVVTSDGSLAVQVTGSDKSLEIRVSYPDTDEELWTTMAIGGGKLVKVEFDQAGSKLRVVTSQRALIFDAKSGEQLAHMSVADLSMSQEAASDDWYVTASGEQRSQYVLCASKGMFNTRVLVANLENPNQSVELPLGPPHVLHPQLSPDGSILAYAASAHDAPETFPPELLETEARLKTLQEKQLARNIYGGGASTYLIYLYETRTGGLVHVLRGYSGNRLNGLCFDPTGTRVCAWGGETPWQWEPPDQGSSSEISIWNIWRSKTATVLQGHTGQIRQVAVSSDGKRLLSSGIDGAVRVWDADSGQLVRVFLAHHHDAHDEHLLSPRMLDSYRAVHVGVSSQPNIAVSAGGNSIRIWNYESGEILRTIPFPKWSYYGLTVRIDGRQLAFISDSRIYMYDTFSGTEIANLEGMYAQNLAYDPAGKRLAVAFQSDIRGELRVYDVATQEILIQQEIEPEHFSLMTTGWGLVSIAFTPDGKRLIAGGNVGAAFVFDADSGKPLMELKGHTATIMSVAVSPDGKRFATGSYDNTVRLWDSATGQLVHTFRDHTQPVRCVAFSPDGKRLISGGEDGIVRIWEAGR